jgi:hypothetical protein
MHVIVAAVVRTGTLVRAHIIPWSSNLFEYASVIMVMDARDATKHIDLIAGYAKSVEILGYHTSFYRGYVESLYTMEERLVQVK